MGKNISGPSIAITTSYSVQLSIIFHSQKNESDVAKTNPTETLSISKWRASLRPTWHWRNCQKVTARKISALKQGEPLQICPQGSVSWQGWRNYRSVRMRYSGRREASHAREFRRHVPTLWHNTQKGRGKERAKVPMRSICMTGWALNNNTT